MELTNKQKLEAAMRENPNFRTLGAWLQYQEKEIVYQLKNVQKDSDFRFIQGKLKILDELQDLLTKATS